MDIIFNCPKCEQELAVDSAGAGSEINCPSCSEKIVIPTAPAQKAAAEIHKPSPNAMASSAAAKVEKHLRVPVHSKAPDSLIEKPHIPLEAAAKESDKKLKTKTIRHSDCYEVGHDRFDDVITAFLQKIGEQNLVSLTPMNYSHVDISSQKLVTDFAVMVLYRG